MEIKKRINEHLYPVTDEKFKEFLKELENDNRLNYYLNQPIEDVNEFDSLIINIPAIKQLRKRSLLFIIKYICQKKKYKNFFIIYDSFRTERITGFLSYIDENKVIKNLFIVSFINFDSFLLTRNEDYIWEKQMIKHYLYLFITNKLLTQSKIDIEITRNDFRTYSYFLETVRGNYGFVYSLKYNEDTDHWIISIAENHSKLKSNIKWQHDLHYDKFKRWGLEYACKIYDK